MSVREASRKTSLGIRFLYRLLAEKKLRHFKIGSRIVIDSEDLDNFIRQGEVEVVEDWGEELGIK